MKIHVLMAGDGVRFKTEGYTIPKPLIPVRGKPIIKWTVDSIKGINSLPLYFSIRTDHQIKDDVKMLFPSAEFIEFSRLTRGGVETALLSISKDNLNEAVLFLDCDNYHQGINLDNFSIGTGDYAVISHFQPIDDSTKWCFCSVEGNKVVDISEKDQTALSRGYKPMVGVFYFSNTSLFMRIAEDILQNEPSVKGEYYMSQSIRRCLKLNIPVFGLEVNNVVPLGTPADIESDRVNLLPI